MANAHKPGELLIRVGGVIGVIGFLATIVALLPLAVSSIPAEAWLWFVAIGGVGIGVGMMLWGLLRAARGRSRFVATYQSTDTASSTPDE